MSSLRTASLIFVPLLALLSTYFYVDLSLPPGTWPVVLRQMAVTLPLTNFKHYEDYTEYDIPNDLSDKVVLITGASSGIGFESARILASRGAKVVVGIRGSRERLDKITSSIPGQVLAPAPLDLSDYDSFRTFVDSLPKAGIDHFDIVLLNAGKWCETCEAYKDGVESMLAAHHLGHAYLFELLTPMLLRSPGEVRVVITSSSFHLFTYREGVRYNVTADTFSPVVTYSNSKLANILYTRELSARLEEKYPGKFVVNTAHPGCVASSLATGMVHLPHFIAYNTTEGAMPLLRPAVEKNVTGDGYYLPVGYRGDWQKDSAYWWTCNDTMRNEFWEWTKTVLRKVHTDAKGEAPMGSLMLG
ncbi:hypothetical protein FOZ60_010310 [Perkinsus olseni]|uniref:Dehydrogenase/reductase SDR member 12 n=1 Tax=Perkinsus olseni TaxID=32597 RepID=A0A7J6NFJ1_PEROL|nr:hypothetical protein FOZ60_010310 [Perkinsus olseni]